MTEQLLATFSNQIADAIDAAAAAVVQVQGARRPASGVVFADDVVLTTAAALGRENGVTVRTPDGRNITAEIAGWDPATHLAVLRAPGLGVTPATASRSLPRVGHFAIAIARSWSNVVTATVGNIAVIGGPLPTGRGRAIEQIIRTTAPMHRGFAGGALVDAGRQVVGITTAAEIRGLGVVIPAAIAWKAAGDVLAHGHVTRGYLGLAGQPVQLPARQRTTVEAETALLVVAVTAGSPADAAGVMVGDLVTSFAGEPVDSPERLLELLVGDRVGRSVPLTVMRGGTSIDLSVTVGQRPAR